MVRNAAPFCQVNYSFKAVGRCAYLIKYGVKGKRLSLTFAPDQSLFGINGDPLKLKNHPWDESMGDCFATNKAQFVSIYGNNLASVIMFDEKMEELPQPLHIDAKEFTCGACVLRQVLF